MDALRPLGTRSVPGCIPTRSVATIMQCRQLEVLAICLSDARQINRVVS